MTTQEAKICFYAGFPVEYDGQEYERISALILRKPKEPKDAPTFYQLELQRKDGRSVTIAAPDRCSSKTLEECDTLSFFKTILERNDGRC